MKSILKNAVALLFIFAVAAFLEIGKHYIFEDYKKAHPVEPAAEKPEQAEEEQERDIIDLNKIRDVRVLEKTIEIELESGDVYVLNYD